MMHVIFQYNGEPYKEWPNWTGEIPQKGDTVFLHFGDYNEEEVACDVKHRQIDGRYPDTIKVIIEPIISRKYEVNNS